MNQGLLAFALAVLAVPVCADDGCDSASFVLAPERLPTPGTFGGTVHLPQIMMPGIYQVTVSQDAWLDVIQEGRHARAVGSSGRRDCPEVRKSVRFELVAGSVSLQFSRVAGPTITVVISPGR
jgi:hypothetical protein